jgi:hypothetical protein
VVVRIYLAASDYAKASGFAKATPDKSPGKPAAASMFIL